MFLSIHDLRFERNSLTLLLRSNPRSMSLLRRVIMKDIEILAISKIIITQNDSVLPDQALKDRLENLIIINDDNIDSGKLILDIESTISRQITGKDIIEKDVRLTSHSKNIVLTNINIEEGRVRLYGGKKRKLKESEKLRLIKVECEVRKSSPSLEDSYLWNCVTGVTFSYIPRLLMNNEFRLTDVQREHIYTICPSNVFDIEDLVEPRYGNEMELILKNPTNCTMCNLCIESNNIGLIDIYTDTEMFTFRITSNQSLTPGEIFKRGLEIAIEKYGRIPGPYEEDVYTMDDISSNIIVLEEDYFLSSESLSL